MGIFNTKKEILIKAKESAECTHNHPEGIKGAQATALSIMMARQGASKEEIRAEIEKEFNYNLHFTCDEIRPAYSRSSRVTSRAVSEGSTFVISK